MPDCQRWKVSAVRLRFKKVIYVHYQWRRSVNALIGTNLFSASRSILEFSRLVGNSYCSFFLFFSLTLSTFPLYLCPPYIAFLWALFTNDPLLTDASSFPIALYPCSEQWMRSSHPRRRVWRFLVYISLAGFLSLYLGHLSFTLAPASILDSDLLDTSSAGESPAFATTTPIPNNYTVLNDRPPVHDSYWPDFSTWKQGIERGFDSSANDSNNWSIYACITL